MDVKNFKTNRSSVVFQGHSRTLMLTSIRVRPSSLMVGRTLNGMLMPSVIRYLQWKGTTAELACNVEADFKQRRQQMAVGSARIYAWTVRKLDRRVQQSGIE